MARKLFIVAALISLVVLVQAAPGLADTYNLEAGDYSWVETHGDTNLNPYPGSVGSELHGSFTAADGTTWRIGDQYWKTLVQGDPPFLAPANLNNSTQGTATVLDSINNVVKFTTTYDTVASPGTVKFSAHINGGPDISSTDALIIMTEIFKFDAGGTWSWQSGSISGSGTSNSVPFTLSGTLYQNDGDHTHNGGITNFTLTYPAAAPTPIPGAVWLLGSGLLGLGCVGWRRRA